jgi:hypothetical protein
MRIRLRVPKDGKQNDGNNGNKAGSTAGGLAAWFQSLFSPSAPTVPAVVPALDHRWRTINNVRYLFIGRHCRRHEGRWQSEYTFDIRAGAELHHLRVILAEPPVDAWERRHGNRMGEESRFRLATQKLEALASLQQFPATATVDVSAVDSVVP